MINKYKTPMFRFIIKDRELNGITAQPIKLKYNVKKGDNKNINLFALFGKIISLMINFKASAKG
jgi:hypothetical protein